MIALVAGYTAKKLKLREKTERKDVAKAAIISSLCAMGFNVIVDPIFGYFYKKFILRIPAEAASIILTWSAGVTALNGAVCTVVSVLLYLALYKSFRALYK